MTPDSPLVTELRLSPNHDARTGDGSDILLLHYTGMETAEAALVRLCDTEAKVSAHYVVREDGGVVQMVAEARRAWHAGAGTWAGRGDVNARSIGIEIVNGGHVGGLPAYPEPQLAAVIALARDILRRHAILPERVLAHSDIAPERKEDPGEHFPWERLAREGIGHWAGPLPSADDRTLGESDTGPDVAALQGLLARYGYEVSTSGTYDERTRIVVTAFQRHFRPARVDGIADRATTAMLRGLVAALPPGR